MRVVLVGLALLAVGLSGCTDGSWPIAADAAGQGQWSKGTLDDVDFPCDGVARFDAGMQGQGHMVITVRDALGQTLASVTMNGQGQKGVDKEIEGQPGQWNLKVVVKDWDMGGYDGAYGSYDYGGYDFQGQYGALVQCVEPES